MGHEFFLMTHDLRLRSSEVPTSNIPHNLVLPELMRLFTLPFIHGVRRHGVRFALGAALLTGCGVEPGTPDQHPLLAFSDVTKEVGLGDVRHENGGEDRYWFPEPMGAGGGFVDYDGDDWEDILVVGGGRLSPTGPADVKALRLFRNNRDGTFTEVTDEVGLADIRAYSIGVAVADYDNDGDQDVYLTAFGENMLFRNDPGSGPGPSRVFTEIGKQAGVASPPFWSSSALFFDADRDGHLDLYVAGYAVWSVATDVDCHRPNGRADYCAPATYPGGKSYYYHNNGDGSFTERTAEAGFANTLGKSLAVAEWDFNSDGWSDLVVVNDGEPDLLYLNNGDGTFTEKGVESGIAYGEHGEARAGMGVDVGVVDSTGMPSIFIGNFSSEMIGVYRQTKSRWFGDRSAASGVGRLSLTTLAFGVLLFDADLDTDLDLFVANGHVYLDPIDGSKYRQPPHLFMNKGDGTFIDRADSIGGVFRDPLVARAVAKADYDRDGDLDLLVTENNGPVHLFRNDSQGGGVLRIRLEGTSRNRDALGAQVTAVVGGLHMQRRVRTGSGYLSQSEKVLTFGLGSAAQVDTLIVRWPNGDTETLTDLPAGYEIRLIEGEGEAERTALPVLSGVASK